MSEQRTRFFEIPDDVGVMVSLVEAIPDTWACVCGDMVAPASLLDAAQATPIAGYLVGEEDISIVAQQPGVTTVPDYEALVAHGKRPGFVKFARAGLSTAFPFARAKPLVCELLAEGYRGRLCFWCGSDLSGRRVQYTNNPVLLDIAFSAPVFTPGDLEPESTVPRVRLALFTEHREWRTAAAPILAACAALEEYSPAELAA